MAKIKILKCYQAITQDYDTRVTVLYGGAGSGKSYFGVQKTVLKALRYKRKVLVVRKVGATIRTSIWDLFLEILVNINGVIKSVNKSDMQIELVNGSIILFKGLDDAEKIKSVQGITDILIEEATELSLDDYTQLNLRLRSKEPYNQITLMFNPVSKTNWVYKYFFENGAPDDCVIVHTTYKDNIHLPKEYIDSIMELEKRNPAYFRIYVLGEFATLDKLVFPIYEKRIISDEETASAWFWCGMDFGYTNDPTAITWGYYDTDTRTLYITGEYDQKGMTNDKIADVLISLGLQKEVIVADCAEPKSIAELRRFGIRRIKESVKGKDSIMSGIDAISRCKIVIDERCTHVIEEFENYTWQKDRSTGDYVNRPIDTFNHHIDSIRYGIQPVIKKRHNADAINTAQMMYL